MPASDDGVVLNGQHPHTYTELGIPAFDLAGDLGDLTSIENDESSITT